MKKKNDQMNFMLMFNVYVFQARKCVSSTVWPSIPSSIFMYRVKIKKKNSISKTTLSKKLSAQTITNSVTIRLDFYRNISERFCSAEQSVLCAGRYSHKCM